MLILFFVVFMCAEVTTSPDVFHNIGSIMRGESAPDVAETNEVPKECCTRHRARTARRTASQRAETTPWKRRISARCQRLSMDRAAR